MTDWIKIHIESGEFCSFEEGKEIFHNFYDYFIEQLDKRCIFIVDDITGEKVGTATISLLQKKEYVYNGAVDWVAIKRKYQGKKLSRPLISKFVEIANNLGHKNIILHTQTTTWLAAKLYLDYGFNVLNKNEKIGWSILNTLINNTKLSCYKKLTKEEIYEERNKQVEYQLNMLFPKEKYNYSVWYKNGLHNVYVYYDNNTYEYEYFEENGKLKLIEVINKKYKSR